MSNQNNDSDQFGNTDSQDQYSNQGQYGNQDQYSNQNQYGNQDQYNNQGQYSNQDQYANQGQYTNADPNNPQNADPFNQQNQYPGSPTQGPLNGLDPSGNVDQYGGQGQYGGDISDQPNDATAGGGMQNQQLNDVNSPGSTTFGDPSTGNQGQYESDPSGRQGSYGTRDQYNTPITQEGSERDQFTNQGANDPMYNQGNNDSDPQMRNPDDYVERS